MADDPGVSSVCVNLTLPVDGGIGDDCFVGDVDDGWECLLSQQSPECDDDNAVGVDGDAVGDGNGEYHGRKEP